ncbi:hypothetical protein J4711_15045 [Staphylococcus epidermidis]|nr:hypothetical protein [Staphylococcus epidermidis]
MVAVAQLVKRFAPEDWTPELRERAQKLNADIALMRDQLARLSVLNQRRTQALVPAAQDSTYESSLRGAHRPVVHGFITRPADLPTPFNFHSYQCLSHKRLRAKTHIPCAHSPAAPCRLFTTRSNTRQKAASCVVAKLMRMQVLDPRLAWNMAPGAIM